MKVDEPRNLSDRLRDTVALDDRIIALREQVSQSTDVRFREGVVTVSDYLARVADLQRARMAKTDHEVQLAQAGLHVRFKFDGKTWVPYGEPTAVK